MQAGFILNPSGRVPIKETCSQYLLMAYPQSSRQLGLVAPPIELAVFQAKEPMEATIIRWMHRIISNQQQFLVPMEQVFDTNGKRLQARIQDKSPFQQLAKQLKVVSQFICSYDCPEMIFSIQPHVQISKTIADPAYHLLLAAQQAQSFVSSFNIKELILLRKHHDFDSYKPMNVFALRP